MSGDFHNEGSPEWQALASQERPRGRLSGEISRLTDAINQALATCRDGSVQGVWIDLSGKRNEPIWLSRRYALGEKDAPVETKPRRLDPMGEVNRLLRAHGGRYM